MIAKRFYKGPGTREYADAQAEIRRLRAAVKSQKRRARYQKIKKKVSIGYKKVKTGASRAQAFSQKHRLKQRGKKAAKGFFSYLGNVSNYNPPSRTRAQRRRTSRKKNRRRRRSGGYGGFGFDLPSAF